MSNQDDKEADAAKRAEVDGREPYEPPVLECDQLFEVLALSCGKVVPRLVSCRGPARRNS
jgi:hypothetical protein